MPLSTCLSIRGGNVERAFISEAYHRLPSPFYAQKDKLNRLLACRHHATWRSPNLLYSSPTRFEDAASPLQYCRSHAPWSLSVILPWRRVRKLKMNLLTDLTCHPTRQKWDGRYRPISGFSAIVSVNVLRSYARIVWDNQNLQARKVATVSGTDTTPNHHAPETTETCPFSLTRISWLEKMLCNN